MNKPIKVRISDPLEKLMEGDFYITAPITDTKVFACSECKNIVLQSSRPFSHLLECGLKPTLLPLVAGTKVELEVDFDELVILRARGLTNMAWCDGFERSGQLYWSLAKRIYFSTIAKDEHGH